MSVSPSLVRLAVCATHPIQYQAPIWRALANSGRCSLQVYFGSDVGVRQYSDQEFGAEICWDVPLVQGYQCDFLSTDPSIKNIGFTKPSAKGLSRRFRVFSPQVVLLTAYMGRFHLESFVAARRAGAKIIMRHEASDAAQQRSGIKEQVRDSVLRWLYSKVDAFAVIGSNAKSHLLRLGVSETKMIMAPYCVDTIFFDKEYVRLKREAVSWRKAEKIPADALVIVFSGKIIPKKGPMILCAALARLPESVKKRIHLVAVGSGQLEKDFSLAAKTILGSRAHVLGFLNQSEIGRIYSSADLLVLPSMKGAGETWGLVVNEAMLFGLPAIVSDGVGCAPDLIRPDTGSIFPTGDADSLAVQISLWFERITQQRCAVKDRVRKFIADWSVPNATAGILDASCRALHHENCATDT